MGVDLLKTVAVGVVQRVAHVARGFGRALVHQVDERQGGFAFGQVVADVFADFSGVAAVV